MAGGIETPSACGYMLPNIRVCRVVCGRRGGSTGAGSLAAGECQRFRGAFTLLGMPAGLPLAMAACPLAAGVGGIWGAQSASALLSRGAQSRAGSTGAGAQVLCQSLWFVPDDNFVNYCTAPTGCRFSF